jgi:hypothetical protein
MKTRLLRAHPPRVRTAHAPNFGRQLTRLRGTQSRAAVCRALRRYGITVDRSTLFQYEHGHVTAPDPAVLWALGRYYGLETLDELLTVLVMDRTGRSLRAGVEIAVSPFDAQQRRIAEAWGTFPDDLKAAVLTVVNGLQKNLDETYITSHATRRKQVG